MKSFLNSLIVPTGGGNWIALAILAVNFGVLCWLNHRDGKHGVALFCCAGAAANLVRLLETLRAGER